MDVPLLMCAMCEAIVINLQLLGAHFVVDTLQQTNPVTNESGHAENPPCVDYLFIVLYGDFANVVHWIVSKATRNPLMIRGYITHGDVHSLDIRILG